MKPRKKRKPRTLAADRRRALNLLERFVVAWEYSQEAHENFYEGLSATLVELGPGAEKFFKKLGQRLS